MLGTARSGHHGDRRLDLRATPGADPDPLVELVDVPMTLAGLSRFNVENALAAPSASLAVGWPREPSWRACGPSGPTPSTTPAG